jgi:hypothetical protein
MNLKNMKEPAVDAEADVFTVGTGVRVQYSNIW